MRESAIWREDQRPQMAGSCLAPLFLQSCRALELSHLRHGQPRPIYRQFLTLLRPFVPDHTA